MSEQFRFPSLEEKKEQETKDALKEEGGILYETTKDSENGEEKNYVNVLGVKVETYASKEDVEEIKNEIILSKLDQRLLRRIAENYSLKQALLFEGDPGAGKTFLFKKFIKMIHGKDAPVLDLVGTPRTSELDILGHWAPKGLSEDETKKYNTQLREYMELPTNQSSSNEFNKKLEELNGKFANKEIDESQFQDEFGDLTTEYVNKQKEQLMNFCQTSKLLKPDAEWEFKEGALLKAYSGNEGRGYPLIVDEFNIIPSNYQQIFLQIGGESGALSESVSFWGNSGKTSYERGKDAWICFASNFPEKTPGRSEVVAPMSDRLVWQVLPAEEYQEKKKAIKKTAGGRLQKRKKELFTTEADFIKIPIEKGVEWDKVLDEKLGEQIADVVDMLDEEFVQYYGKVGDSVSIQGEKRRRTQQMEFSGRNPLRLFSYLDNFQIRSQESGLIDFPETIKDAFEIYYLSRLADLEAREKMRNLFGEIMSGDTGKVKIQVELSLREKVNDIIANGKIKEITKTRKEVLDGLVKSIFVEEEKEEHKKERVIISEDSLLKDALEKVFNEYEELTNEKEGGKPKTHDKAIDTLLKKYFPSQPDSKTETTESRGYNAIRESFKKVFKELLELEQEVVVNLDNQKGNISDDKLVTMRDLIVNKITDPIILLSVKNKETFIREVEKKSFDNKHTKFIQLDTGVKLASVRSLVNSVAPNEIDKESLEYDKQIFDKLVKDIFYEKNPNVEKEISELQAKEKIIVLSGNEPIKQSLERALGSVLELNNAVVIDLDDYRREGEKGHIDYTKMSQAKEIAMRTETPIILLSLSKINSSTNDLLDKYSNIRFFQQPINIADVAKAYKEITENTEKKAVKQDVGK